MSEENKTKAPEPVGSTDLLGRVICERMLFVFVKAGRIRCYSGDELSLIQQEIEADGWVHTATIDPARWIEHMANGDDDPSDLLDELQFKPNVKAHPTVPGVSVVCGKVDGISKRAKLDAGHRSVCSVLLVRVFLV